jgi:hypothetical protein
MGSVMPGKFREKSIRTFLESVAEGNAKATEVGEVSVVSRDCEKFRDSLPNSQAKKKKRKKIPKTDPDQEDL